MGMIELFPGGQFENLNLITMAAIISAFVIVIMVFACLAFVFMLLTGGIRWMLSGGSKDKVSQAKMQIINALVGISIVFCAWAIVNFVSVFFGVDILTFEIPTINP